MLWIFDMKWARRQRVRGLCCDIKGRDARFAPYIYNPIKILTSFTSLHVFLSVDKRGTKGLQTGKFMFSLESVCSSSYLMRWYVSQNIKRGCAAAIDMVRYILSWFLAPLTNLPSAAASDSNFRRRVRICEWHLHLLIWRFYPKWRTEKGTIEVVVRRETLASDNIWEWRHQMDTRVIKPTAFV